MSRNLPLSLLIVSLLALPASGASLIAPPYPGAVPCGPGSSPPGCFLTRDTFATVRSFYQAEKGEATREESLPGKREYAFFEYMNAVEVHRYDPVGSAIGVSIFGSKPLRPQTPETSLPVVGDIFGQIKMLVVQGAVGKEAYGDLVQRYRHLALWYYPRSDEPATRSQAMDEVIRDRCQTSPAEQESQQDMEAQTRKAQELMMQGRQREALELLQRVGQAAEGVYRQAAGPAGVEKWEKCLRELEANGYPTRIEIAPDPRKS